MKIIDNKKDYYNYQAGIYGVNDKKMSFRNVK